jgi:hypothetical protein
MVVGGRLPRAQRRSVPLLDASANLDEHRLSVFVINRDHQENYAFAAVRLADWCEARDIVAM